MSTTWWRILDNVKLNSGDKVDLSSLLDLAQSSRLDFIVTVHTAGTGTNPVLQLKHAATADLDAFVNFEKAIEQNLTATAVTWYHIEAFTRFIGWFVDGTITDLPVVSVDVIARS